jgi:U3 small nucleolar RNA-associated protein 22
MAPLPLKRRKLSHDIDESSSAEDSPVDSDRNVQNSSSDSEDDGRVVQSKKSQVRQKRAHDGESAVYAGGDYKSSLFKLQVDELLAEVKPNYEKRLRGIDEALRSLKGWIEGIEERDAVSVCSKAL